jgi:hypothetical protein
LFDPVPAPAGGRSPVVVRSNVRLSAEGPRRTLVKRDTPQPAKLTFALTLISKVREPSATTQQPWFTLAGDIKLLAPDSEPLFVVSAAPITVDDPTLPQGDIDAQGRPVQFIFLEFDPSTFESTEPLKVPLPNLSEDVRHLEVSVALDVAGSLEAGPSDNDILDKPIVRQVLDVTPTVALDTPVDVETEHNIAFFATIPDDPFEVETLLLGSDTLVDGETFFHTPGKVFFRPPSKPVAPLKGLLQTTDGRSFEFQLGVAQTLRERMNSLSTQLENGVAMADAAAAEVLSKAGTADDADLVRDRLLNELFDHKVRLLSSIEGTLTSDHEFHAFFSRAAALPPVFDGEAEAGELA